MLSAKWTAVSFFALSALGAASIAFAGCSVTSGTVNDTEGGTVTPTDGGGGTDAPTDSPLANACPGNTNQKKVLISAACQAALDSNCCAELTACFSIVPTADPDAGDGGAGATDDCNTFADCIGLCKSQPDRNACENECNLGAPLNVQTAYDAITTCATNHPATSAACQ